MSSAHELLAVLMESGVQFTFSINCRSGLLGRDGCNCWRCRKSAGLHSDDFTEEAAAHAAAIADVQWRIQTARWLARFRAGSHHDH